MRRFWVVVAIVLVVIAAFAVGLRWYLPISHNSARYTAEDWTVYAQVFGGIAGTLVAAFAFVGLIYTALMQREELSLQRVELRDTRAELKRTADAQEAAEAALNAQVKAAEQAARLNALSALLNSSTQEFASYGYATSGEKPKQSAMQRIKELREELEAQLSAME